MHSGKNSLECVLSIIGLGHPLGGRPAILDLTRQPYDCRHAEKHAVRRTAAVVNIRQNVLEYVHIYVPHKNLLVP